MNFKTKKKKLYLPVFTRDILILLSLLTEAHCVHKVEGKKNQRITRLHTALQVYLLQNAQQGDRR